jgi:hypothetical protein
MPKATLTLYENFDKVFVLLYEINYLLSLGIVALAYYIT